MELYSLSVAELKELLSKEEVSPEEIINDFRKRISEVEDKVRSFVTVNDDFKDRLKEIENKGNKTELWGIPAAYKDNLCTRGFKTTCSSRMLKDYIPPYNATVIDALQDAGAVMVGKTNMDEFAMGSSTENSFFGPTRNPWDLTRAPGGSSGGSAAAVAACEAAFALGSDTGGSIRQPASFCGIVGLKPTYGLVSRYGLVAFASSLDQIGPMTRTVKDAAIILNYIAGHDPRDSTSVNRKTPDYTKALKGDVKGLRLGLPEEYFSEKVDQEVRESVQKAVSLLEKAGAEVEEVSLPSTDYALPAYYIIAPAEASSNLGRYDGVRYGFRAPAGNLKEMYRETRSKGFGPEVKRRIMLGTYALSSGYYDAYYLKAQKVRTVIRREFAEVFEKVDLLITPTTPTTAFKLGEKKDPLQMYLSDILTVPVNIAGLPALSMPCGLDKEGLPVGLQMIGKAFGEETILNAAYSLEQLLGQKFKPEF